MDSPKILVPKLRLGNALARKAPALRVSEIINYQLSIIHSIGDLHE
jgi:hypothetical protein